MEQSKKEINTVCCLSQKTIKIGIWGIEYSSKVSREHK